MSVENQVVLPQGHGQGHWMRVIVDALADHPRWTAVIWCPVCARPMSAVYHQISETGKITPSLGHPQGCPPCPWHTHPQLEGWSPIPPPPPAMTLKTCERCHTQSRSIAGWSTWSGGRGIICQPCVTAHHACV